MARAKLWLAFDFLGSDHSRAIGDGGFDLFCSCRQRKSAVFTYIAPILTGISGFSEAAVSPILLLFGGGLVVGNIVGGKWADKHLNRALVGSLILLSLILFGFTFMMGYKIAALVLVALLGFAGFATVPPLQMRALENAAEAPTLASALNIAAFNLGNAIGAWAGGVAIDHGGLHSTTWTALGIALVATGSAYASSKLSSNSAAVRVDRFKTFQR